MARRSGGRQPGDQDDLVRGGVDHVLAEEVERGRSVGAEGACERHPGPNPGRGGDGQGAGRARERPVRQHLAAIGDETRILADGGAAGAAELDVGLTAIAWVRCELERHFEQ